MITKTLGTLIVVIVCIMIFPLGIAVIAGVFGILAGVFGVVFGGIMGLLGGIFGAVFGVFGWIFDGLFDTHWPFGFFNGNVFTLAMIIIVVALLSRPRPTDNKKTP